MNKTIKTFLLFGIMMALSSIGMAQKSVNAAGGDATGSGGVAAYTVGQVVYTTVGADGTTVAQGVQQAYQQEAAPIPTLSEWGMMILMLLITIVGVLILKVRDSGNMPIKELQCPDRLNY
jgi:hypothetical protein